MRRRLFRDEMSRSTKYNIERVPGAAPPLSGETNANQGRVTIEYVMLDHVNDGTEHAHQLAIWLKETPVRLI